MIGHERKWNKWVEMKREKKGWKWTENELKWKEMTGGEENGRKWKEMKRNGRNLEKILTNVRKVGNKEDGMKGRERNWMQLKRNEMKSNEIKGNETKCSEMKRKWMEMKKLKLMKNDERKWMEMKGWT